MFVIALVAGNELVKTTFKPNANDAINIAHTWYQEEKGRRIKGAYIVIDQQINGKDVNGRFAELHFDGSEQGEIRMYLNKDTKVPEFTSKYSGVMKEIVISFLEFSLKRLHDYFKNTPNKSGGNRYV